jgi:uncharacterized protein (TIGR00299 family) protein
MAAGVLSEILRDKILFIDPIGGLSGDMFLGAFLDLGLAPAILEKELEKVGLNHFFNFQVTAVERHHIAARKVDFPARPEALGKPAPKTFAAVKEFLTTAKLPDAVLTFTLAAFYHLASAEAQVHGVSVADIHFHEVGDYDTLADIVGAAVAIEWLKPQAISLKPIPLGAGVIDCAHGRLPVPVPAVMALLEGLATYASGIKSELVTPTGAAILRTLVESIPAFTDSIFRLGHSGYGAGSRKHSEKPNLLRLTVGEIDSAIPTVKVPFPAETLVTLETVIDDMTPEKLAFLKDSLFREGALEVVSWPVFMKKGRLGYSLMVLLKPALETKIVALLFAESSTLGIRRYIGERYLLQREIRSLQTSFGAISCKIAYNKSGRILNVKPEHEDLARLAERHKLPLTRLEQLVMAELTTLTKRP